MEIRLLRADEIECRVGQSDKEKTWYTVLLYKDARCDMSILDETFGAFNWKREHSRDNANCTVSVWNDTIKEWISKEDTGVESRTEKEKGLASDSFKRACVNWGIGRELYTAPRIYMRGNCDEFAKLAVYVSEITYDDKRNIKTLVLKDKSDNVFFSFPAERKPAQSVIIPKKDEQAAEQAKKPADEREWTQGEIDEYDQACADMDAAETPEQVKRIYYMYKDAIFSNKLKQHSITVATLKGWIN